MNVGSIVAGKYRVTRPIGDEETGALYEAASVSDGHRVVVKVQCQENVLERRSEEVFKREFDAAKLVSSNHVVGMIEAGILSCGRSFMVR